MTIDQFTWRDKFRADIIDDDTLQRAIDDVDNTWACVTTFWAKLPTDQQVAKRLVLENYLVAWQLADLYPTAVLGVITNAGMPLERKAIGGVDLYFDKVKTQDALQGLTTNAFGIRALQMLLSAPEMYHVYG